MVRKARAFTLTLALASALGLAACGADEVQVAPPTSTPTPVTFNVTPCLNQVVAQNRTVANLLIPDVVRLDLTQPAGFPNGRRYLDPVVDITLGMLLLDLRVHSLNTFVDIPLNPNGVDQPLGTTFPFLAPPLGTPPLATGAGSNFVFRTNPASDYVRVERAGMPAVSTALIFPGGGKNEYNDDTPAVDATGKWTPQITRELQFYHSVLADDFRALGIIACAVPN